MPKNKFSGSSFNIWMVMAFLGLVLSTCSTAETVPSIPAAIKTTTVLPTESATATPTTTTAPTTTATTTPTVTATTTPENTPTLETTIPDWPDNIDFQSRIDKENPFFNDWGEGYLTKGIPVYIRTEDLHLDEPFTLADGRFYVQGWTDAWFMEVDGTKHHITVPIMIFDTETFDVWRFISTIETWPNLDVNDQSEQAVQAKNIITEEFTGPFEENLYAMYWLDNYMCFTSTGVRDCGNNKIFFISTGYIPDVNANIINTKKYKEGLQAEIEFFRDILEEIYTKENIEAFWQTFDPDLLKLNEANLPKDFIIPLYTTGT